MTTPLECSLPALAMQSDPTAATRIKRPVYSVVVARETEQNGHEVTACFLPTDTVTLLKKPLISDFQHGCGADIHVPLQL